MINTTTISQNLQKCQTRAEFCSVLHDWMEANVTAFQWERVALKSVFSPQRQPMYFDMLRTTLIEFQQNDEFPGFDVCFSGDGERFSLGRSVKSKVNAI
jgi:hypothetical protein